MSQQMLWHDSAEDALEADINAIGGPKSAAAIIWPTEAPTDGAKKIRRVLDSERPEKFSHGEVDMIVREAGKNGSRCYVDYVARLASAKIIPIEPEDEKAELQRAYISAVNQLEQITKQMRAWGE